MRRYNNFTIGFAAILLIICATGCSDHGSSNKNTTPAPTNTNRAILAYALTPLSRSPSAKR